MTTRTVNPTSVTRIADGTAFLVVWALVIIDTDPGAPVALEYDEGVPVELCRYSDRSVHAVGTWGAGGSLTMQGSNDGTNYYALTDPQGNAITKTADFLEQITELTQFIRPAITAGDVTTSLTVTLLCRLPQPLRT